MAERIVVLGGARSGKSAVAERLVSSAAAVRYVATGVAGDEEMRQRIAAHRARRPAAWETLESKDLEMAVRTAPPGSAVLIDALGSWLAARMADLGLYPADDVAPYSDRDAAGRETIIAEATAAWKAAGAHDGGPVVVVAEEAGLGLVPVDGGARRWIDLSGEIVQRLASDADRVLLVVAGRCMDLAGSHTSATGMAQAMRRHGDTMVPDGTLDFAVNIHGDGPPPHVEAAIRGSLEHLGRYPEAGEAQAAAAKRHGRAVDEVCVTAGAAEALWLVASAVRARRAAIVHPSFTEPDAALRHAGIAIEHVARREAEDWALDPSAIPADADLVVLGNPNNPTGSLDPPDAVAAVCRPGRVTVVDEAFMDFVADPAASVAGRADLPGLVVVRSVTKLWGLAGLRAGYLLASAGLAARCAAARQPWSVAVDALAALSACCADEAYRVEVARDVAQARAGLVDALRALPRLRVWEGAANFVLARLDGIGDAHPRLLARGVAVRPSTFPGLGRSFIRITVRDAEVNGRLVAALACIVEESQ